jgi:predicted N-acetyltransferase YhbS
VNRNLRALKSSERDAVLHLWGEVWPKAGRAYFEHYFTADPEYRDADCQIAEADGRLVAAVLICRRWMEWEGRRLLCGAIANVATLEAYRRQGLSRDLLRQAIDRMEAERFAFSMLFTGRFDHYHPLGWRHVPTPALRVETTEAPLPSTSPVRDLPPDPVSETVQALYESAPHRPLHMTRPPQYFEGWTGWFMRGGRGTQLLLAGPAQSPCGYAVISTPSGEDEATLRELRAMDEATEADLLVASVDRARRSGARVLWLGFIPQLGGEPALQKLGAAKREQRSGMMLRAIALPADEMARIEAAYASGAAAFWRGDDF